MDYNGGIGVAGVLGGLVTGGGAARAGGECWSAIFSPDGSKLAWSCGHRKVVILPWKSYKSAIEEQADELQDSQDAFSEEEDRIAKRTGNGSFTQVHIDAGFNVGCLAFGSGLPTSDILVKKDYYLRFDVTKDLILATGHRNGRIRIWDPYNGKLLLELTDHSKPVTDLSFAPDGSLLLSSASRDGTIKIWDLADDGNLIKTLREHQTPVHTIAWSPCASFLCTAGDKQKVLLWDMTTHKLVRRLIGHYNTVLSCCFSPDGALVATASSDTRVILWDHSTGEQLRVLNHMYPAPGVIYMSGDNSSHVRSVKFAPNGCVLATLCDDGKLRFFDLTSMSDEPISEGCAPQDNAMLTCAFSPLGSALCVGHENGNLLFYASPRVIPSLLHLARMSVRKVLPKSSNCGSLPLPAPLIPYLTYNSL